MRTTPDAQLSASERRIYRSYDENWRLRLTRIIAPFLGVITFLCLIGLLIYLIFSAHTATTAVSVALPPQMAFLGMGVLLIVILLYGVSTMAAYQGNAQLATTTCSLAILTAISVVGSVWEFSQGLDPFGLAGYVFLPLAIVLIGLLTTQLFTVLATLWINGLTIMFTLMAPRAMAIERIVQREALLIIFFCVLIEWCFTIMLIALRRALTATLKELGDVRVAYEQARQLDEIKDQFIRSVNHELRNPVMALNGYVKVLRLQLDALPHERVVAFLDRASRVGDRVVALLKSILDTGQLEQHAAELSLEAVNVRAAVMEAADLIDPLEGVLVQRELHVRVPDELLMWCDRVRFQQVMTNLLSNAVKYSPAGAPITVEATAMTPDEAPHAMALFGRNRRLSQTPVVEITVRDQGLGIPPEQIPLLFQRFMRLPRDIASPVIGNGLGLFLCRRFVEAMHGSIWVESQGTAGDGSTFYVRLPTPPAPN